MPNRFYGESNPNHEEFSKGGKKMGPGMKNEDGREKGSEYNDVGGASASFKDVVYPNENVPSLGKVGGVKED